MMNWDRFAIDYRSVALFRISMGVLLVVDVLLRSRNFWKYYTDRGVVPYSVVSESGFRGTASLPVWELSSHYLVVFGVFVFAFVVGCLFIIGYRSRLMAVLGFLLVSLIDARNPFVLSYADVYYHLLFFWAMFLPLGKRWSIDAIRSSVEIPSNGSVLSFGSIAVLLQVVYMYAWNGFYKFYPVGLEGPLPILYNTVYYDRVTFSHTDILGDVFGELLYIPSFLWAVLLLGSVYLFILQPYIRSAYILSLVGGHVVLGLTARVGAFSFVSIAALFLFVQTDVWKGFKSAVLSGSYGELYLGVYYRCVSWGECIDGVLCFVEGSVVGGRFSVSWRTVRRVSIVGLVVLCLLSGIVSVGTLVGVSDTGTTTVDHVEETINVFGIDQAPWSFFSSTNEYTNYWSVVTLVTESGDRIDARSGGQPDFDRPYEGSELHKQYDTYRDRFYYGRFVDQPEQAEAYADYYCSFHGLDVEEDISEVSLVVVSESFDKTTASDRSSRPVYSEEVVRVSC